MTLGFVQNDVGFCAECRRILCGMALDVSRMDLGFYACWRWILHGISWILNGLPSNSVRKDLGIHAGCLLNPRGITMDFARNDLLCNMILRPVRDELEFCSKIELASFFVVSQRCRRGVTLNSVRNNTDFDDKLPSDYGRNDPLIQCE